ncbi:GNAT family N-acetyltransferase [Streptomyces sp. V4-01]|uniref:GNAT family N-acetyltransferase n=1 Tax=Actinacidiphila polyblastidii TaxID=3110430 RepID=A0ABU7PBU7_9ACTN|nr:GNAT family N-acetyltransferase [Streptomyces sp. V4-01]
MGNEATLLGAYDAQLRGAPAVLPAGVTAERDGPLTRLVGQFRGFVSAPADLGVPEGPELDALIVRQRDYFAARGEGVEWKIRGHDRPAGLPGALRAAGFVPEDRETVMIGRTERMTGDAPEPAGVTLRRTERPEDFRAIGALLTEVWDLDLTFLGADLLSRVAAAPEEIAVFLAEADGRPVSAAWLVFRPGTEFAGLWGGSTLAAYRGRGIYRALVGVRARLAAARGVRYLQVDASDASAPVLARMGFQAVTTTTPYVWSPPTP